MKKFQILTDSCCDLDAGLVRELDLVVAPLSVQMDGKSFPDGVGMTPKELYDHLRAGKMPTTSAVNPEGWEAQMRPALEAGLDVLVIAFSSGLSATYQSAVIAAEELGEQFPGRKILVVDSLCAALGQGLLVYHAAKHRDSGEDIDTVYRWLLENRQKLQHWVTVEDLMHLKRGGRVSATTAVVGTMLSIKPIIRVDTNGKLETVGKCRGRKTALNHLVDKVRELGDPSMNETVFIGHGDCIEDAEYLAAELKKIDGIKNVVIGYVGAVIGAHTGPGVAVVFFFGKER